MTISNFEEEAENISRLLPQGNRIAIIGSASFWHSESEKICSLVGELFGNIPATILITGGRTGVGEAVGRAFHKSNSKLTSTPNIYHILPHGFPKLNYGQTLYAGNDMNERREILGRVAGFYLSIEGGPGTYHEISVALSKSAIVIPLARFGGWSSKIYEQTIRPQFISKNHWKILGDPKVTHEDTAKTVVTIFKEYLKASVSN